MKTLLGKLSNQQIKEQMFLMAPRVLEASEQKVYGLMFDELEVRLTDSDFDSFLDQLDEQVEKMYAN